LMFDGTGRTYPIATCAQYNAVIWVLHNRLSFAVFFFKFVCAKFAVIDAFSATDAFLIVYGWVPWYLASWNSVPSVFRHLFGHFYSLDVLFIFYFIAIFKYCYRY